MTTVAIIVLAVLAVVVAAGIGLVVSRILSTGKSAEWDPIWFADFSVSKYRPMLRLLSDDDFRFLAMQNGFKPDIAKRLRADRRKIFRAYLRNLVKDYARLHAAARALAAHAKEDRSQLAADLLNRQVAFSLVLTKVQLQLALHTIGVGTVDVRRLFSFVEGYRNHIAADLGLIDFA